jgi:hypothetical protein
LDEIRLLGYHAFVFFLSHKTLLKSLFCYGQNAAPKDGVFQIRQARQELNPQHPLLESGALPIELLAFVITPLVVGCRFSGTSPPANILI